MFNYIHAKRLNEITVFCRKFPTYQGDKDIIEARQVISAKLVSVVLNSKIWIKGVTILQNLTSVSSVIMSKKWRQTRNYQRQVGNKLHVIK